MKIVHIVPGTGGAFYCENCVRDGGIVSALRALGNEVTMVPMYLPILVDEPDAAGDTPIFFGAVNVYLKQKYSVFRHAPEWLNHLLDSRSLLKLAASQAGSTRAEGLEEMTLSMLRGEDGNQSEELAQLIDWLKNVSQPDVVYLSNALLLGLAPKINRDLNIPVVCALQDEDSWINTMQPDYIPVVWQTLTERAKDVAAFIPVSQFYADIIQPKMQIPDEKLHMLHLGLNLSGYQPSPLPFDPPVIGFLSRMAENLGLGVLVDAFLQIKQHPDLKKVQLHLTGGATDDDKGFIKQIRQKLAESGVLDDVKFFPHFEKKDRIEFLRGLTVLSVPMTCGEAFGVFQLEALAAGVPVVLPNIGAFPEVNTITGGGIIYKSNTAEALATALTQLLLNPAKVRELGEQGRQGVQEKFSNYYMARKLLKVYQTVTGKS